MVAVDAAVDIERRDDPPGTVLFLHDEAEVEMFWIGGGVYDTSTEFPVRGYVRMYSVCTVVQ